MKTQYREKPLWLVAGLRVTCLGLIALLLLLAPAPAQATRLSGGPPIFLPGKSQARLENLSPPGLRPAALNRENFDHPDRLQVASLPASEINQDGIVRPASLGRLPWRCPLPPASAFHLQTNLRKYLET